jgi:ketosteroid isomerase-like protein
MSQENVEIVRLGYEALNRGDVGAAVSLFDRDAEIVTALSVVEGGSYRGQEGLRSWWRDVLQQFADVRFVGRDFTDFDDVVLVTTTIHARGRGSAVDVDQVFTHVFRFRDAKIVWFKSYRERAAALEAVGRSE